MQGLQVFDASGVIVLDVTDRLTRVLGSFYTGTANGSIVDNNLSTGIPWYFMRDVVDDTYLTSSLFVLFTSSGLSWAFENEPTRNTFVTYGVY